MNFIQKLCFSPLFIFIRKSLWKMEEKPKNTNDLYCLFYCYNIEIGKQSSNLMSLLCCIKSFFYDLFTDCCLIYFALFRTIQYVYSREASSRQRMSEHRNKLRLLYTLRRLHRMKCSWIATNWNVLCHDLENVWNV